MAPAADLLRAARPPGGKRKQSPQRALDIGLAPFRTSEWYPSIAGSARDVLNCARPQDAEVALGRAAAGCAGDDFPASQKRSRPADPTARRTRPPTYQAGGAPTAPGGSRK